MESATLREQILNRHLKVLRSPAPSKAEAPYVPVHVQIFMPGERLTFPAYVKVLTGGPEKIRFLPYFAAGEILQASWLQTLKEAGITRLYVHEEQLDQVLAYLNNHLFLVSGEEQPSRKNFILFREHLHASLYRAFSQPHLGKNIQEARKSLENILGFLQLKGVPWQILWELLYRDYSLYNHCVNVALLGLAFLLFLKAPRNECLNLGLAGLFHDVGLTCLDVELVNKNDPLSPEERQVLEQHPLLGYRLLKPHVAIPVTTLRLILEHHENADGSGYPQGLPLERQHPHTRIIFLLECYDAMTNYRPYRPAHSPFAALKRLQELRGSRGPACEPHILRKFIEFLALA